MTTAAHPARPQRADVTAAHDLGVDVYAALWSPVILRAAKVVVAALSLNRVLDVGAGSGALVPSLDSEDAIDRLLTSAGLSPTRIWRESLSHQWQPSAYYRFATGYGRNRQRLRQLDAGQQGKALRRARQPLSALDPDAFAWSGEVVCAIAIPPDSAIAH